ncbi:putative L,D-transpeptidase YkuD [Pelotomaculum propionicicum]|uniref:Putative L,D-transpeptidase YkuD n=1 Tax=Pelotomaculum propionicicum TaxID=258475 RepID=A0A4Y7RYD2_9FIRM|nr:putative L,D-transpeptidase YkuD [Pelotomaculum propionicicum]
MTVIQLAFLLAFPQVALTEPRVLINKGTNQLALFENGYLLDVFPVATGRQPQFTPEGDWRVVVKLVYPAWRHPDGGPLIPGGVPENPLGPRWLGINALGTSGSNYGVHGNNAPYSIGTYASSGCVRMYNDDIVWLYERIPVGTEVEIVNNDQDLAALKKYDHVTVNDIEPEFPPHLGLIQAGKVAYLPVRQIVSYLGYRVIWDDSADTLLVSSIEREVLIKPGSRFVTVNTKTYEAGDAPFLLDDMTYVPDYYFKNFFGFENSIGEGSRTLALRAPVDPNGGRVVKYNLAIQFNGKPFNLPESLSTLKDGQNLLVPLRPFCAAAGATVGWNDEMKTVEIKLKDKQVSIPVNGSPSRVNGVVVETPANIFIHNGTSYLNLSFLDSVFGFSSELSEQTRTLKISTAKNAQVVFRLLPSAQLSLRMTGL